jgi:outer membrane protein, multidrug efflux system
MSRPIPAPPRILHCILMTALVATAACTAVGPDYERPEIPLPASYTAELERGLAERRAELDTWWEKLGDPKLNEFVTRALESNLDLRIALTRIRESRAARGIAATELVPRVDVSGAYDRRQISFQNAVAFGPRANDQFSVGLDASWEIDLWGRIRRNIEAAEGDIGASVEDARAILVSVIAETALAYLDLRTVQERILIAEKNIGIQEETLRLAQDRLDAGLVSELDVAQAGADLERTRAALPPLFISARAATNRLAVLLGSAPGTLEGELDTSAPIPAAPMELAVGIPADLLRRRPDIRRAERELAAATARIGVAEGDLYPRLSFNGNLGFQAENAGDLFKRTGAVFGLSPSFTWNLFDRQRILGNVDIADARTEAALASYELTILRSLEEVENAMTGFSRDQATRDALSRGLARARRAVELAQAQYRQGLVSFQAVLDSQARLFGIEDSLATTSSLITADAIALYKALGGGWESRDIILVDESAEAAAGSAAPTTTTNSPDASPEN